MEYKLIGENNIFSPLETILHNRDIKDIDAFLKAGNNPEAENHYSLLKNIDRAVECIVQHIGGGSKIWVQVDPDV